MFATDNLEKRKEMGVFSKVLIPANIFILEFQGDIFDSKRLVDNNISEDNCLQIDVDKFLGPAGSLDDYLNHSCACNCAVRIIGNRAFLYTLYQILPDHQITFDYSTTVPGSKIMISNCKCGVYACRKIIGGYNTLPNDIKNQYEQMGIVPAYVKENS